MAYWVNFQVGEFASVSTIVEVQRRRWKFSSTLLKCVKERAGGYAWYYGYGGWRAKSRFDTQDRDRGAGGTMRIIGSTGEMCISNATALDEARMTRKLTARRCRASERKGCGSGLQRLVVAGRGGVGRNAETMLPRGSTPLPKGQKKLCKDPSRNLDKMSPLDVDVCGESMLYAGVVDARKFGGVGNQVGRLSLK